MKRTTAVISNLPPDPKREEQDILSFLDALTKDAFTEGKLQYVEPESWKNVGASIVHAVRIIKDHQIETGQNLVNVRQFLEKFSAKVFRYMRDTTADVEEFKRKVKQDIQASERNMDDKLKAFKVLTDDSIKSRQDLINTTVDSIVSTVQRCETKVAACDTTANIVRIVKDIYDEPIEKLGTQIKDLDKRFEQKIETIYKEELREFGMIGSNEGEKFKTLKEYTFTRIQEIIKSAYDIDQTTQKQIQDLKLETQSVNEILLEDCHPRLNILEKKDTAFNIQIVQAKEEIKKLFLMNEVQDTNINKLFDTCEQSRYGDVVTLLSRANKFVLQQVDVVARRLTQELNEASDQAKNDLNILSQQMQQAALEAAAASKKAGQAKISERDRRLQKEQEEKEAKLLKKKLKDQKQKDKDQPKKVEEPQPVIKVKEKKVAEETPVITVEKLNVQDPAQNTIQETGTDEIVRNSKTNISEVVKTSPRTQSQQQNKGPVINQIRQNIVTPQSKDLAVHTRTHSERPPSTQHSVVSKKQEIITVQEVKVIDYNQQETTPIQQIFQDQQRQQTPQKEVLKEFKVNKNKEAEQKISVVTPKNQAVREQKQDVQQQETKQIAQDEQPVEQQDQTIKVVVEEKTAFVKEQTVEKFQKSKQSSPRSNSRQSNSSNEGEKLLVRSSIMVAVQTDMQDKIESESQSTQKKSINSPGVRRLGGITSMMEKYSNNNSPANSETLQEADNSDMEQTMIKNSDDQKKKSEASSDEKSSSSSASSSENSENERDLEEMNQLVTELKAKFKRLKAKVEGLQTKQMQTIFDQRGFESKVQKTFKQIAPETLEQIVQSHIIQEILRMTSAKKQSPTKLGAKLQSPQKKNWESSFALKPQEIKTGLPQYNGNKPLKLKKLIQGTSQTVIPQTPLILPEATFSNAQLAHVTSNKDILNAINLLDVPQVQKRQNSQSVLQEVPLEALEVKHESFGVENFPDQFTFDKKRKSVSPRGKPLFRGQEDVVFSNQVKELNIIMQNGQFSLKQPRAVE